MGKGISLEDFKNQLESDATKRCQTQEKTIKKLQEELKQKQYWLESLENRCYTLSRGTLCLFCIIDDCKNGNRF